MGRFNFFGHQLSAHLIVDYPQPTSPLSLIDGDHIPIPHFGVVLTKPVWEQLAERLQELDVEFALEPKLRFKNTPENSGPCFCMTYFERNSNSSALKIQK